ncbi:hypothetical protein AAG570_001741 [Ranatra chinensis]|uniref:BTB domain-containing protein n=1 Tax=Ranatra chinensis TaxID=642074 RepID=A0ABD0Y9E9_9HEMI
MVFAVVQRSVPFFPPRVAGQTPNMDQSDKMPIAKRYRALLDSGEFSDCRFIVKNDGEDKEFPAHKLILSITSSVFDCMFRKCYVESKGVIIIDDIDPDTFYQLLVYIYSSEVNMKTIDDAVKLCNAANKYMLFNLTDICFKFVLGKVASSNISMVYSFAMLHERAEIFKRLWQRKLAMAQDNRRLLATTELDNAIQHSKNNKMSGGGEVEVCLQLHGAIMPVLHIFAADLQQHQVGTPPDESTRDFSRAVKKPAPTATTAFSALGTPVQGVPTHQRVSRPMAAVPTPMHVVDAPPKPQR